MTIAKAVINVMKIARKIALKVRSARKNQRAVVKRDHLPNQQSQASPALTQKKRAVKKAVQLPKQQLKLRTQERKNKVF